MPGIITYIRLIIIDKKGIKEEEFKVPLLHYYLYIHVTKMLIKLNPPSPFHVIPNFATLFTPLLRSSIIQFAHARHLICMFSNSCE